MASHLSGDETDRAPQTGRGLRSFLNERTSTLVIVAVVTAGVLSAFWTDPDPPQLLKNPPASQPSTAPRVSPDMVPLVTGEEAIPELFRRAGCPVCHTIPGIEGAMGKVGPPLTVGTSGPQRLADPNYRGRARTVREYVIESILTPSAYMVPGYPDRTMPPWYGKKLTAQALDTIAAYLEGRATGVVPSGERAGT